ncbi:MAG: hypothetical protein KF790_11845 [Steroidobacteraceae bacterium]|nr:hypothetical protein [Steroidobacteraceae bacterium]
MMGKHLPARAENLRRAIAQEAARIMAEHGIRDFYVAKRKAAERYGVFEAGLLPKNTEIEAALASYQRLFGGDTHAASLRSQRAAALHAMQWLAEFEPRLVGPVLAGTATGHVDVQLHLFTGRAESVTLKLMDHGIPHEVGERRVKMSAGRIVACPTVSFEMDGEPIEAIVFPRDGIRQAPVSPVDGRPMRRADVAEVAALVADGTPGTTD